MKEEENNSKNTTQAANIVNTTTRYNSATKPASFHSSNKVERERQLSVREDVVEQRKIYKMFTKNVFFMSKIVQKDTNSK